MAHFAALALLTFAFLVTFTTSAGVRVKIARSLQKVNLMCTEVTALLHSTFAQCVAMVDIYLPPRLKQIGKEVFLNCIELQEVVIPIELQDIGIRAFLWVRKVTVSHTSRLGRL